MGQGDSKWDPTWGRARSGHGRPPFGETVITAWHLDRPATERALESIEWEVLRARRSGALVAPAGTGRTHLLRIIAEWINPVQWESVYLPNPMLAFDDVCGLIFGLQGGRAAEGVCGLERRLEALWGEGRSLLLLVDDAEHMPEETVQALLDLAERHAPTLVVLFAVVESAAAEHPRFGADREGFPVILVEATLDEAEAGAYLQHRLSRSGTADELVARFTGEAMTTLHALSGGVATRLHTLAQVLVETPAEAPEEAWARFLEDERGIIALGEVDARPGSEGSPEVDEEEPLPAPPVQEIEPAPQPDTEPEPAPQSVAEPADDVDTAPEPERVAEVDPLVLGADVSRPGPVRVSPDAARRRRRAGRRRRGLGR